MLLTKIETHNRLNGYRFSAFEFGGIALSVGAFAAYFWAVGRWPPALVATGIAPNRLPVVRTALCSWVRHDSAIGHRSLRDPATRAEVGAAHPHLLLDTLMLTVLTLLPFAVVIVLGVEQLARRW